MRAFDEVDSHIVRISPIDITNATGTARALLLRFFRLPSSYPASRPGSYHLWHQHVRND